MFFVLLFSIIKLIKIIKLFWFVKMSGLSLTRSRKMSLKSKNENLFEINFLAAIL